MLRQTLHLGSSGVSALAPLLSGQWKPFGFRCLSLSLGLLLSLCGVVQAQQVITKAVSVLRDPVHGNAAPGPYAIPGAELRYTITISGPGDASTAFRTLVMNDNLSDDLAINATITDSAGVALSPGNEAIRIAVTSGDAARAGEFFFDLNDVGATTTGSGGNSFGENLNLNFTLLPGVLPISGAALKGELYNGEQVTVEFNVTLR